MNGDVVIRSVSTAMTASRSKPSGIATGAQSVRRQQSWVVPESPLGASEAKEKAARFGAAKFREETSKKAGKTVSDRVAAVHNVANAASANKLFFAPQHAILLTIVLLTGS